jgi:hypothetical protein
MPATLPLGEWTPDLPSFNNPGMTVARNVVPLTSQSYGPLPSLTAFTGNRSVNPIPALPDEPFGLYSFLNANGNEHIITGTKSKLYQFKTGDSGFVDVSGVNTHYSVTALATVNHGHGYAPGDIVTVVWPTSFTTSQITIDSVGPALYHVETAAFAADGTGYAPGNILTLVGGTFTTAAQVTVDTVGGGGAIVTCHLSRQGDYSVKPTNPAAVTGGAGTGAQFNLTWLTDATTGQVLTAHVSRPGDYTDQPNNPVTVAGGTGDGVTFNLTTTATTSSAISYTATSYNPWSMTAFGNAIIATNGDDPPQCMNIDTDRQFSPLNRYRAPFGKYVCTVRNFLMLANVTEPSDGINYPQRVHWSAIGDAAYWPDLGSTEAAQVQSDAQDLRSDLGHIRGIASNLQAADLVILLDDGVYTGRYVGSPAIFDFQIAQGAVGCRVPRSVVVNNGICYYCGSSGFVAFDGNTPSFISANKIAKWFFSDPDDGVDIDYLYLTQGSADPTGRLIMWAYCGPESGGIPNRLLVYNWQLNRWSMARINISWLGQGLSTGYSLDQLDQFGTLDTLTPELDSPFWQGGKPYLLAFDADWQVSTFAGPNLAATIETLEGQPTEGKRSRATLARPIVDGGVPSVSVGSRNRLEDAVVYSDPVAMNAYGGCPIRVDARFMRGRITIPAAAVWQHIQGVEVEAAASTYR